MPSADPDREDAVAANPERRRTQRFYALRRGAPCFWITLDDTCVALADLSLNGCSFFHADPMTEGSTFRFVLSTVDVPDRVRGLAEVVAPDPGSEPGQVSCLFRVLDDDGEVILLDWLVVHVMMNATVRIRPQDARRIVTGGSIV